MSWNSLIESIIEHGLWPTLTFAFLFFVATGKRLRNILSSVESFKVGDVTVTMKAAIEGIDALDEFKKLKSLTANELHLYLVVGGEGGETSQYISKTEPDRLEQRFSKLSELGLIIYSKKDDNVHFGNTQKGIKLHKAIMDSIYKTINTK